MKDSIRIAMLITDAFGSNGGIAKFNRDLIASFENSNRIEHIFVYPRVIFEKVSTFISKKVTHVAPRKKSKIDYIAQMIISKIFVKDIDAIVCGHINLLPLAFIYSKLCGAKLILIIHGVEAWYQKNNLLIKYSTNFVDYIISVSQHTQKRFLDWSNVDQIPTLILPNCVDVDEFRPSLRNESLAKRYNLAGDPVIMTLGRLDSFERKKGFDVVINLMPDLLKHYPRIKYLIVGSGPDRVRLEEKVRLMGLSHNVVFTGQIEEYEKVDHYNLADAYVMPSEGEGFGIVLIEAASCGIPIIGSSLDGSREALLEGELGVLINPQDKTEIIQAISRCIDNGRKKQRNPKVYFFDRSAFNSKVENWLNNAFAQ